MLVIHFIDVILPIPIQKTFTYSITDEEVSFLEVGMRVAVPFGNKNMYTGLVFNIHTTKPTLYETTDIIQILDENPIVNELQLKHWQWIANYYMCSLGDVYRASLPSAFLLESETSISKNEVFTNEDILEDEEFLIFEALQHQSQLTIHQVADILGKKKVMPIVNELIKKSAIFIQEKIYEQYKPKLVKYVRLHSNYNSDDSLNSLLEELSRAKKQREAVLTFFQLATSKKPIKAKDLEKSANVSSTTLKSLADKDIFEFYEIQTDRINFKGDTNGWHTYEMLWSRDSVTYSVDGKKVYSFDNSRNIPKGKMPVFINSWVPDSSWQEAYSASYKPTRQKSKNKASTMLVDWVDIYQVDKK